MKAAEIIQQSQQLAFNGQSASIEPAHILKALIETVDTPVEYLLKKNNVSVNIVAAKLDELLAKMPSSIRWEDLSFYETEDGTTGTQSLACTSDGNCELVDISA